MTDEKLTIYPFPEPDEVFKQLLHWSDGYLWWIT